MEQPKDYDRYDTNDFIADDFFLQWVKFPDAVSDAFWQEWILAHPHKQQQLEEARAFILRLQFREELPAAAAVNAALERNLAMIAGLEEAHLPGTRQRNIRKVGWWAAAAVIVGAMALVGRHLRQKQPVMVQYAGHTEGVRKVLLPDSSEVILNAHAVISFREDDWKQASKREVWLKGEAFFDIKPVASRPFIVHSPDMDLHVLGTSFNVKEGKAFTNVTLNTGKIKVRFSGPQPTQLYLTPGDFVQYAAKNNKIIKKRVNADLYAVWKEEGKQLKDVTLKEIAAYIEDIYGYHVLISSSKLAREKLSGGLRVKDEKLLLETLSFALNVKIERKADTLLIQPK